ncbi:MAG: PIN/TRAM domain-containing protein [Phycisphaerae bacterium]|nr:PIN/TRAM domain-containing protein [Phycisphaerae bacterium]
MLNWAFRGIFLVIIVAALFTYVSSEASRHESRPNDQGMGQQTYPPRQTPDVNASGYRLQDANGPRRPAYRPMLTDYSSRDENPDRGFYALVFTGMGMAILVFMLDVFTPKKKLGALAGVFFGLLVGLFLSSALADVVNMINESWGLGLAPEVVVAIRTMMAICICYLTISIIMRTKDDVRFVIPYVEFAKQTKGMRPLVLDTSAIVDGRISEMCQSKLFDSTVLVPRFVLNELQLIADSADKLKRQRGRRGLDILNKMQSDPGMDVEIDDSVIAEVEELRGVDQKIVSFAKINNGRVVTTDYNLSKVAQVRGVDVLNINDLASMLKVVALPGEPMRIKIIKPGEESDQGIGYLEDGTMVVVEGARNKIGRDISINVTSSLQTSAGKMIFGKFEGFVETHESPPRQAPQNRRRSYNRRPARDPNTPSDQSGD